MTFTRRCQVQIQHAMILAIIDYVEAPLGKSFVVSDLDFIWAFVVIDEIMWPDPSLLRELVGITSLLSITRA